MLTLTKIRPNRKNVIEELEFIRAAMLLLKLYDQRAQLLSPSFGDGLCISVADDRYCFTGDSRDIFFLRDLLANYVSICNSYQLASFSWWHFRRKFAAIRCVSGWNGLRKQSRQSRFLPGETRQRALLLGSLCGEVGLCIAIGTLQRNR